MKIDLFRPMHFCAARSGLTAIVLCAVFNLAVSTAARAQVSDPASNLSLLAAGGQSNLGANSTTISNGNAGGVPYTGGAFFAFRIASVATTPIGFGTYDAGVGNAFTSGTIRVAFATFAGVAANVPNLNNALQLGTSSSLNGTYTPLAYSATAILNPYTSTGTTAGYQFYNVSFTTTGDRFLRFTQDTTAAAGNSNQRFLIQTDQVDLAINGGTITPESGSLALLGFAGLPVTGTLARRRRKA